MSSPNLSTHSSSMVTITFVILALSFTNTAGEGSIAIGVYKEVTVSICSRVCTTQAMTSHCWSGEDDIGNQVVQCKKCLNWRFRPNALGRTLFTCNTTSGAGMKVQFASYDFHRDFPDRCKTRCLWDLEPDGIHGFNQNKGLYDIFVDFTN